MNILFIGYWSISDGLSEATIRPHLEVLSAMESVDSIIYVSIERGMESVGSSWDIPKVVHHPFYSPPRPFLIDKVYDFISLPTQLSKLCEAKGIDRIVCRSSPAGAIGYLLWRKTHVPYYVESFEPHADYMLEAGTWKKWDIRYIIQRYFEKKQKQTASAVMPVSENYKRQLLEEEQVRCTVEVIPCTVNLQKFKFNLEDRVRIRKDLVVKEQSIVCIYVGKFGDIYYEDEAFICFKNLQKYFHNFFLIILTPHPADYIHEKLLEVNFPLKQCWYGKVPHAEVSSYLSAADFAFCPVKPSPSRMFCSPIKNGEYWASGLPIVISDDIGDDSAILKETSLGVVISKIANMNESELLKLKRLMSSNVRERVRQLAIKYRNPDTVRNVYIKIFSDQASCR